MQSRRKIKVTPLLSYNPSYAELMPIIKTEPTPRVGSKHRRNTSH
jgi:hypothetical protein